MKNLFAIHCHINFLNKTTYRAANRFVKTLVVDGEKQLLTTLDALAAQGITVKSVYDRCGKRIAI